MKTLPKQPITPVWDGADKYKAPEAPRTATPRESKARGEGASKRLEKARTAAGDRNISNAVDYIHGWLDAGVRCNQAMTAEEILNALACWIERDNARKIPASEPTPTTNPL